MKSTLKAVIDSECINKRFRESRSRLSLTLLFAGAIAAALLGAPPPAVLIYSLCVLFIIFRHTENIKSLIKGEERKLGLFKSENKLLKPKKEVRIANERRKYSSRLSCRN